MAYATLMVHVDIEGPVNGRVRLAADLAQRFHAALIGVAGWAPRPAFAVEGVVIDAELTDRELTEMAAHLEKRREQFKERAGKGLRHLEWRAGLEFPNDIVAREARAADLIVVGRDPPSRDPYRALDPGGLILKAGRPVLVVPKDVATLEAKRILIAWKDVREARRALVDALPFLHEAEKVFIVEVCRPGQEEQTQQHIADVTEYLARHRIKTDAGLMLHVEGSVVKVLLRLIQDENIDLIVAGAYGHSRIGEWIFGGVTRDLLANSPICCLFSH